MKPNIAHVASYLFGTLSVRERASLRKLLMKLDARVLQWQPRVRRPHVPRA